MTLLTRRVLLALTVVLLAGCGVLPTPLIGGELIVMEVANQSARPVTIVVAVGDEGKIVGSVDPAIVPARQTVKVRFAVPPTGNWSIFVDGGQLMGEFDLKGRRGDVPMGIDIAADGNLSWWCRVDCP